MAQRRAQKIRGASNLAKRSARYRGKKIDGKRLGVGPHGSYVTWDGVDDAVAEAFDILVPGATKAILDAVEEEQQRLIAEAPELTGYLKRSIVLQSQVTPRRVKVRIKTKAIYATDPDVGYTDKVAKPRTWARRMTLAIADNFEAEAKRRGGS